MAEDRMLNDEILLGLIKANAGGGGGTTNYNSLSNKPQIAGTELQGNKSLADLGIASASDLAAKQDVLTTGDYIDITNGKISVNREIPANNFTYELVTKSTGGDDASMTVKKYANGSLVSSTDYLYDDVRTAVNIDGYFTLQYTSVWQYTLLQASTDHASGYVATWRYDTAVDYTEVFPTEDTSGRKLIIKSEMDAALAGKQDTLTFDDTPTDGSNNPVKSNGIYDSEKDIYATMGEMGAKNLIPYPYDRESGYSNQGATTTYDKNGVMTVNKVAGTDTAFFSLLSTVLNPNIKIVLKPNTRYILSLKLTNATNTSVAITKSTAGDIAAIRNKGTGYYETVFTTPADMSVLTGIILYWASDVTETNAIVEVMIRQANITDGTYQPYAKTNKQLTDDVALLDSEKANTDMVAADFNAGSSYSAGNYCVQDGKLYKFKNNHSGAWSSADVDEVKITGELSALKSGLTNVETGHIEAETGVTVIRESLKKSVNFVSFITVLQNVMTLGSANLLGVLPNGFRPIESLIIVAYNDTKGCPIEVEISTTSGGIYVYPTTTSADAAAQNIFITVSYIAK